MSDRKRTAIEWRWLGGLATALASLALIGCGTARRGTPLHAHGYVAGRLVNARVDSEWAEYAIEGESSEDASTRSLPAELAALDEQVGPSLPDRGGLERITARYSRDMATIVMLDRLTCDPQNSRLAQVYANHLGLVTSGMVHPDAPSPLKSGAVFLVVPGWYWHDRSYDAALDVPRRHLEQYGYRTELLRTDDRGPVEPNAERVARRIVELGQAGKRVIVVSVSKGSAETALALGRLLPWEASRHVLAWVNVNGGLRGTPLADELLGWKRGCWTRLMLWIGYGDNGAGLASMRTAARTSAYASLAFPPHVLILNYSAVPFSSQIVPREGNYDHLIDRYGPHDGTLLIRDQWVDGAPVLADLGYDHFLFDPMIGAKTIAMARVVEELLVR
ncbi:MAG: hypothetical protein FJ297_11905 [Planctomycetes bacterium]|nr:hypothetical protein [Planctomycetota bacterium]